MANHQDWAFLIPGSYLLPS